MVAALRDSRSAGTDLAPQAGIADLHRLLRSHAGHLRVDLDLDGELAALSPAVDAAVYRIVQESVTNTMRHSNATRIDVAVRAGDDAIEVTVHDNGTGARLPRFGPGHGVRGMRERAEALGGSLIVHAGPGGWRVQATLPMKERP